MLSDLPDGPRSGPSGREAAPASPSALPGSETGPPTNGTCGPRCDGSSPSAGLQRCLESRLRANLDVSGSPEYVLTWSHWDIGSGPPICRLRASARPTNGNGCSGWPTPKANDSAGIGFDNLQTKVRTVVDGEPLRLLPAGMEAADGLNPEFSCWLMGFPGRWDVFADSATRLCRRLRRRSSGRSSKRRR